MAVQRFLKIAHDLEVAGLHWQPEVGDEVADRAEAEMVSILIDPQGMTPSELRETYLWLPSVEQMIIQFESRRAILFHAGFEYGDSSFCYKTIIRTSSGHIESKAESFRNSMGIALRDLLLHVNGTVIN